MDKPLTFLDQLFNQGILIGMGTDGLYARSGAYENVVAGFHTALSRFVRDDNAEIVRFPPGMAMNEFERSGYMKSFPQLAGCVHCFMDDDFAHHALLDDMAKGEDWTRRQKSSEIALIPAACYPIYPAQARRGALPEGGRVFDIECWCFRHEPSRDPARMQMFRIREFVNMGPRETVTEFRARWMDRGPELLGSLGLEVKIDEANDPFFGRAGRLLAANQRDQQMKFELLVPIASDVKPTACMSFNYHQDHFGRMWDIRNADGSVCETACVGFGVDRVVLALFRHHGLDTNRWPASVRKALWG